MIKKYFHIWYEGGTRRYGGAGRSSLKGVKGKGLSIVLSSVFKKRLLLLASYELGPAPNNRKENTRLPSMVLKFKIGFGFPSSPFVCTLLVAVILIICTCVWWFRVSLVVFDTHFSFFTSRFWILQCITRIWILE